MILIDTTQEEHLSKRPVPSRKNAPSVNLANRPSPPIVHLAYAAMTVAILSCAKQSRDLVAARIINLPVREVEAAPTVLGIDCPPDTIERPIARGKSYTMNVSVSGVDAYYFAQDPEHMGDCWAAACATILQYNQYKVTPTELLDRFQNFSETSYTGVSATVREAARAALDLLPAGLEIDFGEHEAYFNPGRPDIIELLANRSPIALMLAPRGSTEGHAFVVVGAQYALHGNGSTVVNLIEALDPSVRAPRPQILTREFLSSQDAWAFYIRRAKTGTKRCSVIKSR